MTKGLSPEPNDIIHTGQTEACLPCLTPPFLQKPQLPPILRLLTHPGASMHGSLQSFLLGSVRYKLFHW